MKKQGFTLAEVLITLVIIGVIAAMTLPSLLGGTNKQEIKTGLQKAMSVLSQTITLHYALNGIDFTVMGGTSSNNFKAYVRERFNLKQAFANTSNFATADGIEFYFEDISNSCTSSAPCTVMVDVNGKKGPNVLNLDTETTLAQIKDRFKLYIYGTTVQAAKYSCTTVDNTTTCSSTETTASKLLDGTISN